MLTQDEKYRYNRHLILDKVGEEGQLKLKKAKVLVIGAGGLGCPILQYLAAAGIGTIGIVDFDQVDISNLQRQILFTTEDVGKNKAETAAKRLTQLNPFVNFEVYPFQLTNKNALELFEQYDIIVDGSDNFSTRYMVNDASVLSGKPLVYGSIYKFQGQISVFNYQGGPSYRCLFPTPPAAGTIQNCSEIGVIGVLPGIVGSQQANETIKIILEQGNSLSGKLLLYDALEANYTKLQIQKNQKEIDAVLEKADQFPTIDYSLFCGEIKESNIPEINLKQLEEHLSKGTQLIDVREDWEEPKIQSSSVLNIPLNQLDQLVYQIQRNQEVIVFCQSGIRSLAAIEKLQNEYGFDQLINLKGGIKNYGKKEA
ncbi:MAG: molybdopterin-synthase adenylyltransferase MoeB [Flavobacteriales bacterium]|nr:molybdopterin-synthase adenylyltransferase MoeB [Flavobacteriales bacterium]